ncbi:MAG: hypothetical protein UX44_C0002G0015 [candidate division WWE3 bacterium GW2011_GWA1_46_21]|uniref:4Fe-4S ferredoxin-type domain-containing protein n=4 Tax=Katanobacteria TaxID=422282 RepID=A0A0G1PH16_UNCKA|nr:MAG: hypothetical protein UX44_C0002G0015 [candidate division WWE3 bacterium GW2011_GWA1_46_21]KKU49419.1 MAG: hypothetical protein UX69_C0001G0003 [candidate division WWE3 bacterium GW2011_GWA2_46_9]KKU51416.1 MAG: hypothetical protein UX73_C0002G0016 [candidate division WWE3 bacterium GW2011_GWC1_47_10]KKU57710.1 MAG: hypothetical protein UX79_C0006G0046 [candidate division WWE3 bacterium GW2011_GWB1_47_11]
MGKKTLRVAFPERCVGCELCVMEVQRQLKKVGLDGSLIRILREKSGYTISIDPKVDSMGIEKIKLSCPTLVFSLEEQANDL